MTAESPERLKALIQKKARPRNRSEQEIAGYRDVLKTIHISHDGMTLNRNLVLQLHRDLFKFTTTPGGSWKKSDNDIVEEAADGHRIVRFKPIAAWQTADSMSILHRSLEEALRPPICVHIESL